MFATFRLSFLYPSLRLGSFFSPTSITSAAAVLSYAFSLRAHLEDVVDLSSTATVWCSFLVEFREYSRARDNTESMPEDDGILSRLPAVCKHGRSLILFSLCVVTRFRQFPQGAALRCIRRANISSVAFAFACVSLVSLVLQLSQ